MQPRRSIVFAAVFLAAAAGLLFLWMSLEAPAPQLADASAQEVLGATAAPARSGSEAPSALEVADDSSRDAADIRAPAAVDGELTRTESFVLDDALWIEGRVRFPSGTPADEALEVWMLAPTAQPPTGVSTQGFGESDAYNLIRAARENDSNNEWAVRAVAADGAYRVPCPKSAVSVALVLRGRYLYLADPVHVRIEEPLAPQVLEPVLGGWLVARCTLPAGAGPALELAGTATMLSGFNLDSRAIRRGGGFVMREAELSHDLVCEHRALPAGLRYTLVVSPETLAIATRADLPIAAGKKTEVEIALELGARVRGRVKDERGTPVAGAAIEAQGRRFNMAVSFGDTPRKTESAADGTFDLAGLRAGKTRFSARRDGYIGGQSDEIELFNGETRDQIEIELSRGNQISGRVTWPDTKPARGATVSARGVRTATAVRGRRMPQRLQTEIRSTTADERGEFVLTGLGEGPFTVQAGPPATSDAWPLRNATLHAVAPGASGLALVLRELSSLKGRVVDDTGAPITKFMVVALPAHEAGGWIVDGSEKSTTFDQADGTFLLKGLPDGKYSVSVTADGYCQVGEKPAVEIPQTASELLVTLVPTGSAAGRVVDPSGRPVARATVEMGTPGPSGLFTIGGDEVSGESDEHGDFVLESVPAGTITLTASAEAWAMSDPLTVQILPREKTAGLVIALRSGGRLTGEIYDARGEPAAGRSIQMFSMDASDMRSLSADAAGRFEADHVTPGTYQLIAEPGQREREELERRMGTDEADPAEMMSHLKVASATIKDGETTHVVMGAPPKAPVKLTGTITRAGEPAGDRNLMVIGEGGSVLDSFKIAKVHTTGQYEITLDKPGPVVLVVSTEGDPSRGVEFYATIPEVAEHRLDLVLPLGGIRGRVRGPDGRPLAGTPVQLLSDGSSTSLSTMSGGQATAETDTDGRFEFNDLHPGTFAVAAGGSMGRRFQSVDTAHGRSVRGGLKVEADKLLEGVELELSTPGKIAGRVVDAGGQAVAGATVYVRDAQGELLHRLSACTSDAGGRFTYEGVSSGKYTLSARTKALAARESGAVAVREGETSEVELTLEPGSWLRISVEDGEHMALRAQISVRNERDQEVGSMLSFDALQAVLSEGLSSTERRVGPLPAGKYVVTATTPDGQTTKKSVTLKGQAERHVVLRPD